MQPNHYGGYPAGGHQQQPMMMYGNNTQNLSLSSGGVTLTMSGNNTPGIVGGVPIMYQQQMMMSPLLPYNLKGEVVIKLQNPFSIKLLPKSNTLVMVDGNIGRVVMKDATTGIIKEDFSVTSGCVKGIGVDPTDDSFYIISGKFLIKYDYRGVYLGKFAKKMNLNNPYGCTVDDTGNVYITDLNDCKIVVLSREEQLVNKIEFNKPYDIVFDNVNKLLIVTDQQKDCVRILAKSGQEIRKIGDKGNAKGQFSSPSGVCVDGNSQIFVADYGNHRVQMFDINGRFLNSFGTKGNTDSHFDLPRSLCVDMNGNLYVAEYGNSRVQVFKKL